MAGRVVTVTSPLSLVLDGLPGGTEEVVELQRSVELLGATSATLQVAVKACSVATSGVPGFSVEVRPIEFDPGNKQDALGDPVAAIAIDDTAAGRLLWVPLAAGFGGRVQVAIRCGQPSTGRLSLNAHVSIVCKWREDRRVAVRLAMQRLAVLRRSREVIPLSTLLEDDALLPVAPSLVSVAHLRERIANAQRASSAGRSPRHSCRVSPAPACTSGRPLPPPSSTTTAWSRGALDPLAFPTAIDVVAVSRGSQRAVLGPFRTRGRCVPMPGGAATDADPTACRCGIHHPSATRVLPGAAFEVAVAESLGAMPPSTDGAPLRQAAVFMDDATPWVGGRVEIPSLRAALEVEPVALSGLGPGTYDLELSLVTGECRGRVRSGGFIVLDPLAEANTSTVVGPVSLDGLVHGTMHPSAVVPDVAIRGTVFLPAQAGTVRPGPIVIVGNGVVSCLPTPEASTAVVGVAPLLRRLAANGFIAAAVEGVADTAATLAALGLLRWVELPIATPLELGQLPANCALVGHSRAATAYPAVASYINHVANSPDVVDYYLNPIVAPEDPGGDLEVPPLVELPRAVAATVVSFAPPITPLANLEDGELEADFAYWLVISGTHDGDVVGPNALQVFDRVGSRAPAKGPAIQASVRVRRLQHGSWFDPITVGDLGDACDQSAAGETPPLLPEEGNELNERLVTMWLLGVMFRSRQRAFFEIRNLVRVSEGDVLEYADQAQWRFTLLPWRFFDPTTEAWFLDYLGDAPVAPTASNVSVTAGLLSDIAAPNASVYRMGHVRTTAVLLVWTENDDTPRIEFPAQHLIPQPGGLVLQITGAVPPDGVSAPSVELTFRVGVRVAGVPYWVDLANCGGWRVPEVVNPTGIGVAVDDATRTTVVLSTVSIPISDFGPQVAGATELESVEFDLAATHPSGRFYLSAVAITGWKGETLA